MKIVEGTKLVAMAAAWLALNTQANDAAHGMPPMKAAFDRALEGLDGLATVEDLSNVNMMIIPGGGARDLINQRSPDISQKINLKNLFKNLLMKTQALLTEVSSIQLNEQQANDAAHGMPPMKAAFNRALECLDELAAVEDLSNTMIIPGGRTRNIMNQRSPEISQSHPKNLVLHYFLKMLPKTCALLITESFVKPFEGQVRKFLEPTSGCPCRSPRPRRIWSWLTALCVPSSFFAIVAGDYTRPTLCRSLRSFGLDRSAC